MKTFEPHTPHNLGADRHDPARREHRSKNPSAESRDVREDRSTRKAKLVTGLQVQPSNDLGTSRQLLTRENNRPWAKALAENSVPLPGRKTVDLTLNHVSASVVSVAGSFNDWDPSRDALPQRGSGKWSIQLELEPGRYEYLFVADGYWLPDPLAANRVENPHGGHNSVLRL